MLLTSSALLSEPRQIVEFIELRFCWPALVESLVEQQNYTAAGFTAMKRPGF